MSATPRPWKWAAGDCVVLCEEGIVGPQLGQNVFVNCGRSSGEPSDEDRDLILSAVNSHDAALELAEAVLRQWTESLIEVKREHGITVDLPEPECVILARKFLELAGEKA